MTHFIKKLLLTTLLLSVSAATYALKPGEKMPPPTPILPHAESIELVPVQINLGLDTKPAFIQAKACPSCDTKRYAINKDTRFYAGKKLISRDDIISFNGQIADLIYIPEGQELVQVTFHKVEE